VSAFTQWHKLKVISSIVSRLE